MRRLGLRFQLSAVIEGTKCVICLEEREDSLTTNCNHSFCASCVSKMIALADPLKPANCPMCRSEISVLRREPIAAGESFAAGDTFAVRYHRIHIQGLRLQPNQSFYEVVGQLFGLDDLNQGRLRLICKGAIVDYHDAVSDLQAVGKQPPVLMVMFPRGRTSVSSIQERGVAACCCEWFRGQRPEP